MTFPNTGKFNLTAKHLFLIDSVGACFTGIVLVFINLFFNDYIGMQSVVLTILAGIAFVYTGFSFYSFCFVKDKWRLFLTVIYCANFLYCILMAGLISVFYSQLSILGFCYFVFEIAVILTLAWVERQMVLKAG